MKAVEKFVGVFPKLKNDPSKLLSFGEIDWATGLAFECFGVSIGILATAGISLEELRRELPPYSKEFEEGGVDHLFGVKINLAESVLWENNVEKLRFPGNLWVLEALRGQLKYCVSQFTSERVFVHAGVVAWQDCLIMIPGEGFSGKTTLTAELVKAGATYYSDDFAVLDKNALVYPYPKPLSMRLKSSNSSEQTDYKVEHFGGIQGTKPLAVNLVVITEYQPGARWQPQILTPGQGILEILKHTNNSLRVPEIAIDVLQKVAIQAKIIRSKRGEAQKIARSLLQMC